MTPSTPGLWVTDPAAYRKKLVDLVGSRDPLAVLAETPEVIERIIQANTADVLRTRPFEGKWTPNEIIGHLLDADWVYGYRSRLILSEAEPTLLGMDQDMWVAAQRHNDCAPATLAHEFRAIREANLRLWRGVQPGDLERFGRHDERGNESLGMIRAMMVGHDLWHIDQINRYVEAVASR